MDVSRGFLLVVIIDAFEVAVETFDEHYVDRRG